LAFSGHTAPRDSVHFPLNEWNQSWQRRPIATPPREQEGRYIPKLSSNARILPRILSGF
jgi:hypothetical protein